MKRSFESGQGHDRPQLEGGILDAETFSEQFDLLKTSYPNDARNMTPDVKAGWWKALKNTRTSDFIAAIIAARAESIFKAPTLPMVEKQILDVRIDRAKSNHDYVKSQVLDYQPRDLKNKMTKEIAADVFTVLRSEDITPKKWRALARKYQDVPNSAAPGTMGRFFMDRALTLAIYMRERQRKIRQIKKLEAANEYVIR